MVRDINWTNKHSKYPQYFSNRYNFKINIRKQRHKHSAMKCVYRGVKLRKPERDTNASYIHTIECIWLASLENWRHWEENMVGDFLVSLVCIWCEMFDNIGSVSRTHLSKKQEQSTWMPVFYCLKFSWTEFMKSPYRRKFSDPPSLSRSAFSFLLFTSLSFMRLGNVRWYNFVERKSLTMLFWKETSSIVVLKNI